MTERTHRQLAKDLASDFYEKVRSAHARRIQRLEIRDAATGHVLRVIEPDLFIKSYPTLKDYLTGIRHGYMQRETSGGVQYNFHVDNGMTYKTTPGWTHHYERARKMKVAMLDPHSGVSEHLKEKIYAAVIEDREQQGRAQAAGIKPLNIPQHKAIN